MGDAFYHAKVDVVVEQSVLYVARVAVGERHLYLRKSFGKFCQYLRQHILRHRGACAYAYVSAAALVEQVHVVFHAVIFVEYAAAVFKHEPSGIGEHYLSACAVEESYGVLPFQFVYVFGYCRLAYEQLFSRTCETEVLGHAVECF